jgi:hypothetical protein
MSAGGKASTSTFKPTDNAAAGLTSSSMTCCIRSTSVQSCSLPKVSNRKIDSPSGCGWALGSAIDNVKM